MGWPAAAIGLTVAGGLIKAGGEAQSASAQATAARYQSAVASNNAIIARQNAQMATEIGESQATQQDLKTRANVGAIVATQAGAGVDVNTGSAVDVQSSARELGSLDSMTIRSDAARQAYGYQTQASNFDAESKYLKRQAKQSETAGAIGMFTSLLGSGIDAASLGARFSASGVGGGAAGATSPSDDFAIWGVPQAERVGF